MEMNHWHLALADKCSLLVFSSPSIGSNVIRTDDGGMTWSQLNNTFAFMLVANAAQSPTSAVVGGVGMLMTSLLYTLDGENFQNGTEGVKVHIIEEAVESMNEIP
jgi:hypothetical protein